MRHLGSSEVHHRLHLLSFDEVRSGVEPMFFDLRLELAQGLPRCAFAGSVGERGALEGS